MKLTNEGAQQVLLDRLECMRQKVADIQLEISNLTLQHTDCCYPATQGITVDDSYLTVDGDILTVDTSIP